MQLEKVLEEIDVKIAGSMGKKREGLLEARDIIRKHMSGKDTDVPTNDGWIPVEDRLPERTLDEKLNKSYKKYLVFIDSVDGWDIDMALYDFWNDKKWREAHDGYGEIENVIAWRPLPEPYRPEQPETCKYTGGSCCWPIDQCGDCPNQKKKKEK